MTGIVAAAASISSGLTFGAGLYRTLPSGTVDVSPIDVPTQSSRFSGTVSFSYEWIGYLQGIATTSIQLGANCPYQEYVDFWDLPPSPSNWGGGGNSTCRIWTGATARSGFNDGNLTAFIENNSGAVALSVAAGVYYPMRIQWSTTLPYNQSGSGFFTNFRWAESSFYFQINSSDAVSGQIFYNTQTNGF